MSSSAHDLTTSTSRAGAPTAQVPASVEPSTPPSGRGKTTIAPGVIAAIARQAASEVDGVEGVEATGLGGLLATLRPTSSGGATADVAARRAAIDLRLAVRWPLPVHEVTMSVREHVRARVGELTGHIVTDVDIVVADLPGETRRRKPRVV